MMNLPSLPLQHHLESRPEVLPGEGQRPPGVQRRVHGGPEGPRVQGETERRTAHGLGDRGKHGGSGDDQIGGTCQTLQLF